MAKLSNNNKSHVFKPGERLIDIILRSPVDILHDCYHPQPGLAQTYDTCKWLSSINPELLQCIATASAVTLGIEQKPMIEPPGLFALLSQFRQPELRRSVALVNRFLDVLGNQLKTMATVRPQQ